MLLRAAGATAAALDHAVTQVQSAECSQQQQLHALCAAALAATDMAISQVKVRLIMHRNAVIKKINVHIGLCRMLLSDEYDPASMLQCVHAGGRA